MIVESLLYERLFNQAVRCHICQHRCRIEEGKWGNCRTRINKGGKLYSTIYGEVSTWRRAPIEIKPVYHYLPGSYALSLGSLGCNFLCPGCQNWDISFARVEEFSKQTEYISPDESIRLAVKNECSGISWTYNEPTLWFEYTLHGAILAKGKGLYTNYVTNGFITPEALDKIGPYLDVFRVDIKGFDKKTYSRIAHITNWRRILEVIQRAGRKWHMHVELVTNIIPLINDDPAHLKALAQWIKNELSSDTPWHITRFYPNWRMSDIPPTPLKTLETICEIALAEGLKYVYIGNVPDHQRNNTYCPKCGKTLIERKNWDRVKCLIKGGTCPECMEKIAGKFTS